MRCWAWPVCGFGGFHEALCWAMRARFLQLPQKTVWFQTGGREGLLVGVMGWFVPQVLGRGLWVVGEALNGRMAFQLMALLVVLKLFAVTASYASATRAVFSGPLCSSALCWEVRWGPWHIICFPLTRATPALTHRWDGRVFAGIVPRSDDFGADDL